MIRGLLRCSPLLFLLLASSACTTLKSFSMTQVPSDRSRKVEASDTSGGLFGIFFSNSFADEVAEQLRAQCPQGRLSGVVTKYESTLYVIWVSRKITATGYCLPGAPPPGAPAAPPAAAPASPPVPPAAPPAKGAP
jgi:hypothetical protein